MKSAGTGAGNGDMLMRSNKEGIFEVIEYIGSQPDDNKDGTYKGKQAWAHSIADGVCTFGLMKQDYIAEAAPLAFETLGRILQLGLDLKDKDPYVNQQAATERCDLCKTLLRCIPHTGTSAIPNGVPVISDIICNPEVPKSLKDSAKQAMQAMSRINKEAMAHSGSSTMKMIRAGGNDDLIFTFLTMPEMYTNDPSCFEENIDLLLGMNWMHVCSLLNNVAARNPAVLAPHVRKILDKHTEAPTMGAVTIGILKQISKVDHSVIYSNIDEIIEKGNGVTGSSTFVAGCISNAARTDTPKNAAELLLPKMIDLIRNTEALYILGCLTELRNMVEALPGPEPIQPYMEYISSLKVHGAEMVTSLESFAAGVNLVDVAGTVSELELKVNELNTKVKDSCQSFEDVIAYVDANVADLKDFVGDVVKKLPAPKRLEVVGRVRKTLILHFECVRTHREFPIESKEWSKWLKMGFSLAKAGKAVFDIGTGNPLGLISTGVNCVKDIYSAYKENDEDEFNTYITEPFLTSTEQDQLLEKLRGQGFFEKMDYDSQLAGWYLLDPEKDGSLPQGDNDSITRVSKKAGYGIGEAISSGVGEIAAELELSDMAQKGVEITGSAVGAVVDTVQSAAESSTTSSTTTKPTIHKQPSNAPAAGSGGRAAAMRTQMSASGAANISAVDGKLQHIDDIVDLKKRVCILIFSNELVLQMFL